MKKTLLTLLGTAALVGLAASAQAQVIYSTVGGNYTQDFNWTTGAASGNSTSWVNNAATQTAPSGATWVSGASSLGWYAGGNSSNSTNFRVRNGVQTDNVSVAIHNFFFTSNQTDRIFGGRPTAAAGPVTLALRLTNNTGTTLTSFNLSYELAVASTRTTSTTGNVSSSVGYFFGTPTNWFSENATSIPGLSANLTVTTPAAVNGTFSALNHLDSGNKTSSSVSGESFSWAHGTDLWIRWSLTGNNADYNVGIDNVVFSAIPEPTTWALLAGGLTALVAFRRRKP